MRIERTTYMSNFIVVKELSEETIVKRVDNAVGVWKKWVVYYLVALLKSNVKEWSRTARTRFKLTYRKVEVQKVKSKAKSRQEHWEVCCVVSPTTVNKILSNGAISILQRLTSKERPDHLQRKGEPKLKMGRLDFKSWWNKQTKTNWGVTGYFILGNRVSQSNCLLWLK